MSVTKRAIVFLVVTFAVSWTALISAFLQGHREFGDAVIPLILNAFAPGFAALVCSIAFEKGQRLQALGLHIRPNLWWLWAFLISVGLIALMVIVTALFSPHKLVGAEDMARQLAAPKHQHYSDARIYLRQTSGAIAVTIIAYSILFTLAEELGWRGYLYHLWRRFGFWRFSLVVGLIWGIWHWPSIYLFGLNYPDHRVLGLFIFPIYTALLAHLGSQFPAAKRTIAAFSKLRQMGSPIRGYL
jgi:membrane protease YdiL (CAAX protease family)